MLGDRAGDGAARDLTGTGILHLRADGSLARLESFDGGFDAGLAPGDPDGPAFLVLTGAGHAVDGTRTVTYGDGPVEDLGHTLAG